LAYIHDKRGTAPHVGRFGSDTRSKWSPLRLYPRGSAEACPYHEERVIPMSVHVQFETPEDVVNEIYAMLDLNKNGRVKKGSNEVTKAAERGTAQFIILAEDVNPPELLAHIPLICEEKGIPFGYVPSQEFLAQGVGLAKGASAASVAVMEVSKGAQEKFHEVVESIKALKN
jgi:large subunit ribosomal protein L7Ae